MGLDMYLTVHEYISRGHYERVQYTDDGNIANEPKLISNDRFEQLKVAHPDWVDPESFSGIAINWPAAYWRKANAIHQWFVMNVQDGEDDCREYYVAPQHLKELRDACKQVLAVRNAENVSTVIADVGLEPTPGFFFGSTDVDEWYFEDLQHTVEAIDRLESSGLFDRLENGNFFNADEIVSIHYQSSW
jgi:hypothetical protein